MTHKGTVFKIKPNTLIVMTGEFEFKEIRKTKPAAAGQEIYFNNSDIKHTNRKRTPLAAAACMLVAFLIAGSVLYQVLVPGVYAYLGIDINPSIELAIDRNYKVIKTKARNKDGTKIIKNLSLKGLPLEKAVRTIMSTCSNQEYINKNNSNIMFSTTIKEEKSPGKYQANLEKKLISSASKELKESKNQVNIYTFRVSPQERQEALNKNTAPCRYYIWDKLKEKNIDIDLEQVNMQNINNILHKNDKIEKYLSNTAAVSWKKKNTPNKSNHSKPEKVKNKQGKIKKEKNKEKNKTNQGKKDNSSLKEEKKVLKNNPLPPGQAKKQKPPSPGKSKDTPPGHIDNPNKKNNQPNPQSTR
ncbi:MAG: anti-sigma factor domain-containing protein [Clostridiales bacterium]|nr:anti-sigma factor domain-containing protein [Clostridiales bacterium]